MKAQDLKNSILQLAIQGKLVAQDKNDEPAEVLYAKIQAEKQKLIKEGKIKKDKPLPPITEDEIPFPIPPTWKWVRLGEIANINGGYAFKSTLYKERGIRVIRISDFDEQGFKNDKIVRYEYSSELEQYLIENNNIIMAMTGGTVGKSYYVHEIPERLVSNQRVATIKITCNINPRYINYVVLSSIIQADIQSSKNSTNDNISMDLIKNFRIPLPPLEEQKRIVAKIEELEPLINQYDQAEQELSTLNDKFPEQLKKSILQLAIQGKLVAQDENDEPAEVLYAKIQAEKQKLIKEGKIKKDKPLLPITEDEIPFPIPPTWKWVQLNDVCLQITDGEHSTPKRTIVKEIPLLTAKNIRDGYITYDNVDYVLEETAVDCWKRCCPENQDILMTCVGYIGRSSIVSDSRRFVLVRSVSLIRASRILDISFLKLALDSPELQKQMAINTKQTAQPCLYLNKIKSLYFPLPPLEEQHRIVAKVNNLLDACGRLSNPLTYKTQENKSPITNEWLIDKGFELCSQKGYTDIDEILRELDIDLLLDRRLNKGRIEFVDGRFRIWVADLNDNWTKTHEVVHYVNDNKEIQLYGAVGRKDETSLPKAKEINVDAITAEILMPENIFISALEIERVKKYALVDNSVIRKLRKLFRVSDYAVKVRLQNLGYHTK